MNQFETRINDLRLQFKAEQRQISKDCDRTIGHLNAAIGQVTSPEAREALRAEKIRTYEAMRKSHEWNRKCYRQQLEIIEEEHRCYLMHHPSKRAIRRSLLLLHRYAESQGVTTLDLAFDNNQRGKVTFC